MATHMELLDAVPLDAVNDGLVLAALEERRAEMVELGGVAMPLDQFWGPADLPTYRQAAGWWPVDAPQSCALPTLRELCLHVAGPAGATLLPAARVLALMGERCVKWLEEEGRNIADPNESAEDRRRRLGREAVARHRALTREAASNPSADRVRALYSAYIAACRARKAAYDAATPVVEAARVAWEAARAEG
jgi:hypothetical protein